MNLLQQLRKQCFRESSADVDDVVRCGGRVAGTAVANNKLWMEEEEDEENGKAEIGC